jgi:hypothetical protein
MIWQSKDDCSIYKYLSNALTHWFYRKNLLGCDRNYKPKIGTTRKVRAAINSFETVLARNVVCRYFFFHTSKHAKKLRSETVEWRNLKFLSIWRRIYDTTKKIFIPNHNNDTLQKIICKLFYHLFWCWNINIFENFPHTCNIHLGWILAIK